MNTLELTIENDTEKYNHIFISMKIDGGDFLPGADKDLNSVVFPELRASSKKSGPYLIFTCCCGVADCGGWKRVNVVNEKTLIKWNFSYGNHDYNLQFDRLFYEGEIERIAFELDRLKDKTILDPEHVIFPE